MLNNDYTADIKKGKIDRSNFEANIRFLEGTELLKKDLKILEVGCGAGRLISDLTQKGFSAIGFDISKSLIIEGNMRYPDAMKFLASGDSMPFSNSTFDIVLSFDVLEHISDVQGHLSEVRRILKTGGFYLFQTPNKLTNMPFEIIINRSFTEYKKYHCSLQTFWSLKKLLNAHGFTLTFSNIPIMNEFIEQKIEDVFGSTGVYLLKIVNPDKLPIPLRTNFYVCGAKK